MIKTSEQLIDKIASELVWRRKELTDLRSLVQENTGKIRSKVLMRSATALLYAHWEGFVKKASSYYLEYIASLRLPYKNLQSNFIGLTLKAKLAALSTNEKMSSGNEIAHFFCHSMDNRSNIPYKNGVDTRSNLSSKTLIDILDALGLDSNEFETRLVFIDKNLVNRRNHIAHGEELEISLPDYLELHDGVLFLIEAFRNQIENNSVERKFMRKTAN